MIDSITSTNGESHAPGRDRFVEASSTRAITATQFANYLRSSKVLVVDVRNRHDYDQGHILATSVICIEPVGLKLGMSAEELEDRLVVSPLAEQNLFERRNDFDLVVYYDQQTSSDRFLDGPPMDSCAVALRAMHDCLYEFNFDKPSTCCIARRLGGLDGSDDSSKSGGNPNCDASRTCAKSEEQYTARSTDWTSSNGKCELELRSTQTKVARTPSSECS